VRVALVANPISGRGGSVRIVEALAETLGAEHDLTIHLTSARGDAVDFARRVAGVADVVVAAGGDGTLNEVVNGLAGTSVPVLPVPLGLSNVLAVELGAAVEPAEVARRLDAMKVREIDLIRADHSGGASRFFCAMAAVGFDAGVVERIARRRVKHLGFTGYVPHVVASVFRGSRPFSVTVDGRPVSSRARYLVVGNVSRYGGPFRIATRAVPDDGLFDAVLLEGGPARVLLFYAGVLFGRHLSHRGVRRFRCRELAADGDEPLHVDGEWIGYAPVRFSVAGRTRFVVGG